MTTQYKVVTDIHPELCSGSFDFCWNFLLATYGNLTVKELIDTGAKIVPKE